MSSYFLVGNHASGLTLGIYRAETADDAIAAMLLDAGVDYGAGPDTRAFPLVATVTGRGETSTVPDRADAVDFTVTAGDATVSITLLVDGFSGQLDVWGHPDQWCADAKQARRDFGAGWEAAVVAVCHAAI